MQHYTNIFKQKTMPLTAKWKKIMKAMKKKYGEKWENVFYASKNKGIIKWVEKKKKTK